MDLIQWWESRDERGENHAGKPAQESPSGGTAEASKQKYGNGSSYPKIYNANNGTIEASAKKHGKSSSDNGHWIYPGDVYTIPA